MYRTASRLGVIAFLVLSVFSLQAAAQPAQSHPLSEIVPMDENLDLEGQEIINTSQITIDGGDEPEGLLLDGLTITHEGRVSKLILDDQAMEWRLENADLNMNNNNITNFFGSVCPDGEFMVDVRKDGSYGCVSAAQEVQDEYVNRIGDSMNGTLDMADNNLIGLRKLETSGSGVYLEDSSGSYNITVMEESGRVVIPSGNLDVAANNLEGVRNLRLVDSGNTNQYNLVYDGTNGRLALSNAGEDVLRIDDSTNNLILPGGGLDMQNSNIVNFFDAACASGNVMVQVNSDGTFSCVDATNEVDQDFVNRAGDTMTGTLDMQTNNIIAPGEVNGVNLSNPGNAIVISGNQYAIPSNAIQTDELDESATYNLGWGNLAISQTDITVADVGAADTNLNMNGYDIDSINSLTNYYGSACPSGEVMVDVRNNGNFGCVNVTNEVQDTYVNRNGDTMTGTLDMQGNNILQPGQIQTGGQTITIRDTTNTQDIARFNEGGSVEVVSGNLNMNSNNVNAVNTINNGGTTLNTGGSVNVGSGAVTSSTNMCIGDQC